MVRVLWWVLAGVLLYSVVATLLSSRGILPEWIRVQGPITTLHTERGKAALDWIARPKRFWRAWSNVGLGFALVMMVGSFFVVLFGAFRIFQDPSTATIRQPQNALVIPGVNDFLPLSVAPEIVLGLLVGLVVHEGGHGVLCRVEGIGVDSMGLALLTLVPMGAFVEPDEEESQTAARGARSRMFAAGVTNNFVITIVSFGLLFVLVSGSIVVASGVPVQGALPGSPADRAGIGGGDVIDSIDGQPVANASDFDRALADANRSNGSVAVGLANGTRTTVERSVIVTRTGANPPLDPGATITAVNDTRVNTTAEFRAALDGRTTATITTENDTVRMPIGARVSATAGDPLANESGVSGPNDPLTIVRANGQSTPNRTALAAALDGTRPDETIPVVAVHNGERRHYNVTLAENPNAGNEGFLGVLLAGGTNGIVTSDFGIDSYPADRYLGVLSGGGLGGGGSLLAELLTLLLLPLASVGDLGPNFAGFVGPTTEIFTVTGPLSALGAGTVFFSANVLFWTGWINVQLGFFNCIPSFPLDGGHLLRAGTESVTSRLPIEEGTRRGVTSAVTTAIGVAMVAGFVLLVFGPTLLSA